MNLSKAHVRKLSLARNPRQRVNQKKLTGHLFNINARKTWRCQKNMMIKNRKIFNKRTKSTKAECEPSGHLNWSASIHGSAKSPIQCNTHIHGASYSKSKMPKLAPSRLDINDAVCIRRRHQRTLFVLEIEIREMVSIDSVIDIFVRIVHVLARESCDQGQKAMELVAITLK